MELELKKNCFKLDISTVPKNKKQIETEPQAESKEPLLKCRYIATLMGFLLFFSLNAYRINMSVAIVAMVNNSALAGVSEAKSVSCPIPPEHSEDNRSSSKTEFFMKQGEFDWSPKIQSYILSSYYLAYTIVQIPFGKLVERYGCKWFFFWGCVIAALAATFIPFAARIHPFLVIPLQAATGMGQGFYQPAAVVLVANWFPKLERGLLYSTVRSGSSLGPFFGSIFSGLLCQSTFLGGWPSTFYLFGFTGLILSVLVYFYLHESPSEHPKISEAELKYILNNQENTLSKRRPSTPWREVYRSIPIYALAIGLFGQFWATSQFIMMHSTYLGTILHFPIKQNGFYTALPFLLMFTCVQVSSWLSSFFTQRRLVTVNFARKFWNLVATLGLVACYLGIYLSGCNGPWNIALSCLSVGFTGFSLSGAWITPADMSPTFAATINSICVTFGLMAGFVLPITVGYLTNEMQTIEQWHKVFFISIGVVMTSGIVFTLFGSAEIQPWNDVKEETKEDKDENQDKLRY